MTLKIDKSEHEDLDSEIFVDVDLTHYRSLKLIQIYSRSRIVV